MKRYAYILLFLLGITALAMPPQDDKTRTGGPASRSRSLGGGNGSPDRDNMRGTSPARNASRDRTSADSAKTAPKAQPKALTLADETIPDSLLNARWRIQPTAPIFYHDLDSSALDLHMPDNIKLEAVYNDSLNLYFIGSLIGRHYLSRCHRGRDQHLLQLPGNSRL